MSKAKNNPAVQALVQLANEDKATTWSENAVLVSLDDKVKIDVDAPFKGNYNMVEASAYNDAADLCRVVIYQFLHPLANINPDVTGFNLTANEKRAYETLFKLRTTFGFTPDSQAKFAAKVRGAQDWYVSAARRKHPISLGNLVSAVAAQAVHKGESVPSYLETAAKRFKDNLAEHGSVIKPEGAKSEKVKSEGSAVSLKPSELNMVEAAEKELRKVLSMGNMPEMLAAVKAAQELLFKVVQNSAKL